MLKNLVLFTLIIFCLIALNSCFSFPKFEENYHSLPSLQNDAGRLFLLHSPKRENGIGIIIDGDRIEDLRIEGSTYIDLKAGDHTIEICDPDSLTIISPGLRFSIKKGEDQIIIITADGQIHDFTLYGSHTVSDKLKSKAFMPAITTVRLKNYTPVSVGKSISGKLTLLPPKLLKDEKTSDGSNLLGMVINDLNPNWPGFYNTIDSITEYVKEAATKEFEAAGYTCIDDIDQISNAPKVLINIYQFYTGTETGALSINATATIQIDFVITTKNGDYTIDTIGDSKVNFHKALLWGWETEEHTIALNQALQSCFKQALPQLEKLLARE